MKPRPVRRLTTETELDEILEYTTTSCLPQHSRDVICDPFDAFNAKLKSWEDSFREESIRWYGSPDFGYLRLVKADIEDVYRGIVDNAWHLDYYWYADEYFHKHDLTINLERTKGKGRRDAITEHVAHALQTLDDLYDLDDLNNLVYDVIIGVDTQIGERLDKVLSKRERARSQRRLLFTPHLTLEGADHGYEFLKAEYDPREDDFYLLPLLKETRLFKPRDE